MQNTEINLHTSDGTALYAQEWRPETNLRSVICVVHGLGEHGGQYANVAEAFVKQGIGLVAIDLRGHGRSDGRRGHAVSYDSLLDDIGILLAGVSDVYPGVPLFLYGHSLGGNLIVNYALRRQPAIAGIVATAPWLRLTKDLAWYKRIAATLLEPFWPALTLSTANDREENHEEAGFRRNPELYHSAITIRMLMSTRRAGIWAAKHGDLLGIPALIIHGTADRITDPQASAAFARQAGSECDCILLPGVTHNPHEEDASTIESIVDWVSHQISGT